MGIVDGAGYDSDASTKSWKSQRVRLFLTGEAENGVKFVIRSHWSNGDIGGSNYQKDANGDVSVDQAYIVIPDAFAGFTLQAGKLPFYAKNGMILSDNHPGLYASRMFGDIYFGVGGFTWSENNKKASYVVNGDSNCDRNETTSDDGMYTTAGDADDDSHGFVVSASKGNYGLDVLAQTNRRPDLNEGGFNEYNINGYKPGNVFWFSPWYSFSMDNFSVTVNPMYMMASFEAKEDTKIPFTDDKVAAKDVDAGVMALSLNPSYSLACGTRISANVLYISGVAADDQDENIGWMNMSSFYCQGLEFFGSANSMDFYGDLGNVVDEYGQTAIAVFVDHPILSNLSAHLGLGYVMSSEDVEWDSNGDYKNDKKDNVLGTEIDLGLNWMVKENVSWGFSAVYVMPGDGMVNSGTWNYNYNQSVDKVADRTDDPMALLSTNLTYSF